MPAKILFLTANPTNTTPLKLDEEIRLIGQRIRRGEYRKLFDVRPVPALRATDLPYELMDGAPDIVHFSGHGSPAGELAFQRDGDGAAVPIPASTLARVFKQLRDRIQCVVLNACYSELQAAAIVESIPCVVGMSRAVPDATAIAFAAAGAAVDPQRVIGRVGDCGQPTDDNDDQPPSPRDALCHVRLLVFALKIARSFENVPANFAIRRGGVGSGESRGLGGCGIWAPGCFAPFVSPAASLRLAAPP